MIMSFEMLRRYLDDVRWRTCAFTNGCFDIIHMGHTKLLKECTDWGCDYTIVGINSDISVKKIKNPSRPIMCEEERAEVIDRIKGIDFVVLFDDPTPYKLIEMIEPTVLIKGGDWKGNVVGQEFVESYGGTVKIFPIEGTNSTTNIIKKCREAI